MHIESDEQLKLNELVKDRTLSSTGPVQQHVITECEISVV